jgi:transcriptional regulator with XRE-family HTH domain
MIVHPVEVAVAARVRRLRVERGWTLDEAATELGVSRRSLVQVEAGAANPSLTTLLRLASGLGIPLAQLVQTEPPPPAVTVGDEGTELWRTRRGSRAMLLVGSDNLELWRWRMVPGDHRDAEPHTPGTLEALLVMTGELTVVVAGTEVRIPSGRSALFGGDTPHAYRNENNETAEFILAVHEPTSRRHRRSG